MSNGMTRKSRTDPTTSRSTMLATMPPVTIATATGENRTAPLHDANPQPEHDQPNDAEQERADGGSPPTPTINWSFSTEQTKRPKRTVPANHFVDWSAATTTSATDTTMLAAERRRAPPAPSPAPPRGDPVTSSTAVRSSMSTTTTPPPEDRLERLLIRRSSRSCRGPGPRSTGTPGCTNSLCWRTCAIATRAVRSAVTTRSSTACQWCRAASPSVSCPQMPCPPAVPEPVGPRSRDGTAVDDRHWRRRSIRVAGAQRVPTPPVGDGCDRVDVRTSSPSRSRRLPVSVPR